MAFIDKIEIDVTLKQVASTTNIKYDGTFIQKGSKKVKVQVLKSPDYVTNYNKRNQTLYVAPRDARRYDKLKQLVHLM